MMTTIVAIEEGMAAIVTMTGATIDGPIGKITATMLVMMIAGWITETIAVRIGISTGGTIVMMIETITGPMRVVNAAGLTAPIMLPMIMASRGEIMPVLCRWSGRSATIGRKDLIETIGMIGPTDGTIPDETDNRSATDRTSEKAGCCH